MKNTKKIIGIALIVIVINITLGFMFYSLSNCKDKTAFLFPLLLDGLALGFYLMRPQDFK